MHETITTRIRDTRPEQLDKHVADLDGKIHECWKKIYEEICND